VSINRSFFVRLPGKIVIVALYCFIFAFFLYLPLLREIFLPTKMINVCVFAETFSPEAINRFEKKTGIQVNLTYAEIDEQVYAKFRMNGAAGYDVINVSDYMVRGLGAEGFLRSIDQRKMPCIEKIEPRFLNRVFDPGNVYSVPHKWYVYGIVYDKKFFNKDPDEMSLDLIFKDPHELVQERLVPTPYKLCMLDDGRDAFFMTAIYLFGRVDNLGPEECVKVKELLIKQKKWVEAYTVHSAQYFLTADVTPIALMSSNYVRKMMASSERFAFAIPREGSMLIIENLVIPQHSVKADLAYQFINFMLSDEIALLNSQHYGYSSANRYANNVVNRSYATNPHLVPDMAMSERLFIPLLPPDMRKLIEEMWLAVGFA
jgi:spermidine/putrescine transport system substrate-binding protein